MRGLPLLLVVKRRICAEAFVTSKDIQGKDMRGLCLLFARRSTTKETAQKLLSPLRIFQEKNERASPAVGAEIQC
jgi:hypothetical protein